jgi:hypothetical protein
VERSIEDYQLLVGSRYIDPKNRLTYETVDIKVTPNRDIVAWRRRVIKGSLQDTPEGPFHAEDIYQYTHTTLRTKKKFWNQVHIWDISLCAGGQGT